MSKTIPLEIQRSVPLGLLLKDKNKTLQVMKLSFDKSSGNTVDSTAVSAAFPDFLSDQFPSESQGVEWKRNGTIDYYYE